MTVNNSIVFVVDDDQAMRRSMEMLIGSVGLHVETFPSAQEFLRVYDPNQPGCMVLDVRMPGMSGLELQTTLRERNIDLPIIMVTGHGDVPVAVQALKNGAFEFLEKPFSAQILLEYIHDALHRDMENRLQRSKQDDIVNRLATLTERERQVMDQVVVGKVNKEIAASLGLSKKTIEVHRAHVMRKLKVDTLAELVELAVTKRLAPASNSASV